MTQELSGPQSDQSSGLFELPVRGSSGPLERADAARNRQKVLAAAERLFAERGADAVSMDDVAAAAGVGKGTLFRRFGDRAGLARALLSEREGAFQEELIRGPAPLGPGAPAVERLVAFGRGLLGLFEAHGDLLVAAEVGSAGARFRASPYAVYRLHLTLLLREALPLRDAEYLADALLSVLGAELLGYLRRGREMSLERIADGYESLVRSLCG